MTTLRELIEQYGANGFVQQDAGNGCGLDSAGEFCFTADWSEEGDEGDCPYLDVNLESLAEPYTSGDGYVCNYGSEWIVEGEGDNPYRVRVLF